jgi:hypothetical protein
MSSKRIREYKEQERMKQKQKWIDGKTGRKKIGGKKKERQYGPSELNRFFAALERSSALKQCPRRSVLQ